MIGLFSKNECYKYFKNEKPFQEFGFFIGIEDILNPNIIKYLKIRDVLIEYNENDITIKSNNNVILTYILFIYRSEIENTFFIKVNNNNILFDNFKIFYLNLKKKENIIIIENIKKKDLVFLKSIILYEINSIKKDDFFLNEICKKNKY